MDAVRAWLCLPKAPCDQHISTVALRFKGAKRYPFRADGSVLVEHLVRSGSAEDVLWLWSQGQYQPGDSVVLPIIEGYIGQKEDDGLNRWRAPLSSANYLVRAARAIELFKGATLLPDEQGPCGLSIRQMAPFPGSFPERGISLVPFISGVTSSGDAIVDDKLIYLMLQADSIVGISNKF